MPREANLDADRLSHPSELDGVQREAVESGLHVVILDPHADDWDLLQRAIDNPPATRPRKRPKPSPAKASALSLSS